MMMPPRQQFGFLPLLLLLLALPSAVVLAEPPPELSAQAEADVWVQRVYAPADDIANWPTGGATYIPIAAKRFERFLQASEEKELPSVLASSIIATIDEQGQLNGKWSLTLARFDGEQTDIWLPIAAGNAQLVQARNKKSGQPLRVAWWGTRVEQRAVLAVQIGGATEVEIAIRGNTKPLPGGRERFVLPTVTESIGCQIELTAPSDHELLLSEDQVLSNDEVDAELKARRFKLACVASRSHAIELRRRGSLPLTNRRQASYSEQIECRLTRQGCELTGKYLIDTPVGGRRGLRVEIPASVAVANVAINGNSIPFEQPSAVDRRLRIDSSLLPQSGPTELMVRLWSPFPLNASWRIPQPKIVNASWREGQLNLELVRPLELIDLRRVDVAAVTGSSNGSSWTLQKLTSSGTCELTAKVSQPPIPGSVGHSVSVNGNDIVVSSVVTLPAASLRNPRQLQATLRGQWQIESVIADSGNSLTDWYEDREGNQRRLVIELSTVEAESGGVRLTFQSRLNRSARNEPLPLADLEPFRLKSVSGRRLLSLSTFESLELVVIRQPEPLQFVELRPSELATLPETDGRFLYDCDAIAEAATVRLQRQQIAALGRVKTHLTFADATQDWWLEYQLECRPRQGTLVETEVFFTRPLPQGANWSNSSGLVIEAKRLNKRSLRQRQLPAGGELWRITWASPVASTAEVRVACTLEQPGEWQLPLATLLETEVEQARLSLHSQGHTNLGYLPRQLRRLPLVPDTMRSDSSVNLAAWDYAADDVLKATPPGLSIAADSAHASESTALVSRAKLLTTIATNGICTNRYTATIDSDQPVELVIKLPTGATRARLVSGNDPPQTMEDGALRFIVGDSHAPTDFQIDYSTRQHLPQSGGTVEPQWPSIDLPVSESRWTLRLPMEMEFQPASVAPMSQSMESEEFLEPRQFESGVETPNGTTWNSVSVDAVGQPVHQIRVASRQHQRSQAYAMAGLLAACGYFGFRRFRLWVGAAGLCGGLWVFAPAPLANVAAFALVGLLVAAGLWIVVNRRALRVVAVLLAVVTPVAMVTGAPPAIEKVFVPTGENNQPEGDRVFVSREMLQTIVAKEQQQRSAKRTFAIEAATVSASIPQPSSTKASLRWTIRGVAKAANTVVSLPLNGNTHRWQPVARIDGVPRPIEWNADKSIAKIQLQQSGVWEAELTATANVRQDGSTCEVELPIPPSPVCQLALSGGTALDDLSINERPVSLPDPGNGWSYRDALTGGGTAVVAWRRGDAPSIASTNYGVKFDALLRLLKDDCTLAMACQLDGDFPAPQLVFSLDGVERGRLVTSNDEDAVETPLGRDSQGRWILPVVALAEDDGDQLIGRLKFDLSRRQPLGRLLLHRPLFEGGLRSSFRLTLSTDSSLSATVDDVPEGAVALETDGAASELLDIDSGETQVVAYDLSGTEDAIEFSVTPSRDRERPDELVKLLLNEDECRVIYQAEFPESPWPVFRRVVRTSPGVELVSVTASDAQGRLPIRITPGDANTYVLLFDSLPSGRSSILVEARCSIESGKLPVPQISTASTTQSQRLQIFCTPELTVSVPESDFLDAVDKATMTAPPDWIAYGVGTYRTNPKSDSEPTLSVAPNRPRLAVDSVLALDARQSQAEIVAKIENRDDPLIQLQLEIPGKVVGEIEVSPSASVTKKAAGRTGPQIFEIRLSQAQPAGSTTYLRIRYELSLDRASGRVQLPRFLETDRQQHWIALSTDSQSSGVWSLAGVSNFALPESFHQFLDPADWRVSRVASPESFEASWQPKGITKQLLKPTLIHHATRLDAEGRQSSRSEFVFAPSRVADCEIVIPSDCEVLGVRVDGEPTIISYNPKRPERRVISLGIAGLPHVVEVRTRVVAPQADDGKTRRLVAPHLLAESADLALTTRLWSVDGLRGSTWPTVREQSMMSVQDVAAIRLSRFNDATLDTTDSLAALPEDMAKAWVRNWIAIVRLQENKLEDTSNPLVSEPTEVIPQPRDNEWATVLQTTEGILSRLSELASLDPASSDGDSPSDNADTFDFRDAQTYGYQGESLTLSFVRRTPTWRRWVLVSLWSVAVVTLVWGAGRVAVVGFLVGNAEASLLVIGLVAAVLITPFWVGGAIAFVAAIVLVRRQGRAAITYLGR